MSADYSITLKLHSMSADRILEELLAVGWDCERDNQRVWVIPLGGETGDWEEINLSNHEVISYTLEKLNRHETAAVNLLWEQYHGGTIMFFPEESGFLFSPIINTVTIGKTRRLDAEWYLERFFLSSALAADVEKVEFQDF